MAGGRGGGGGSSARKRDSKVTVLTQTLKHSS